MPLYDRKGRCPREDAAIWNRYFMEHLSEHPEWLTPQDEADILIRYIYSLETEEEEMKNTQHDERIGTIEHFLGQKYPEKFDFKRLMKEYYEKYKGNFRGKIGETAYSRMMEAMPYMQDGESTLANYLKYKNTDALHLYSEEKKRYIVRLFDCDSSNDTCELSADIYETLWGWNLKKRQTQAGKFDVNGEAVLFGPDTMNTGATMLNEYVKKEYEFAKCSVKKLYECIVLKEAGNISGDQIQKLEDIFGEFLRASGTIGNFTLVPLGFNVKRYQKVKDNWPRSLKLLSDNTKEEFNRELGCGEDNHIIWDKSLFVCYVNMTFQWEFCEFIKEYKGCEEHVSERQKEICDTLARLIERRGIFMTAMLKLATGCGCEKLKAEKNSDSAWKVTSFYKKVVDDVLMKERTRTGYAEVFEHIRKLAEREMVSDDIGRIIEEAENKLMLLA